MKILGAQTIVSNHAPQQNPNRIVYTQEDMLGIHKRPEERAILSQSDMIARTREARGDVSSGRSPMIFGTGNSFSDPLAGFDDDGPMW